MTTLVDAFLEDIIESPDDDTPRLIYADWLEDNDREKEAEFIRVQLELAILGKCENPSPYMVSMFGPDIPSRPCGTCSFCRLLRASHELLHPVMASVRHEGPAWFILELCKGEWWKYKEPCFHIQRGFIEEIVCDWSWWEGHHAEMLRTQPVRKVYLTDMAPINEHLDNPMTGRTWYFADGPEISLTMEEIRQGAIDVVAFKKFLLVRWPSIEFILSPIS